jgi:acetylornithine/succinyldiaminopimelate/putrescine aminotransferase
MAKGLGGGFPLGAIAYSGSDFDIGDHGGTFNGGPLASAAALEVIKIIEELDLLNNAKVMGKRFERGLSDLDFHGLGLMMGLDVDDGRKRALQLIEKGLIPIYSANILRLLPPLTINEKEVDFTIKTILEVLK